MPSPDEVVTFVREGHLENVEVAVPAARQGPALTLRDLAARATERVVAQYRLSGVIPRQCAAFIRDKGWNPHTLDEALLRAYVREWVNEFFDSADRESGSAPLKG